MIVAFSPQQPKTDILLEKPRAKGTLNNFYFTVPKSTDPCRDIDKKIQAHFSDPNIVDSTLLLKVVDLLDSSAINRLVEKYKSQGFGAAYSSSKNKFSIYIPATQDGDIKSSLTVCTARTNLQKNTEQAYERALKQVQKELKQNPSRFVHKFILLNKTTVDISIKSWIRDQLTTAGYSSKSFRCYLKAHDTTSAAYKMVQEIKQALEDSSEPSRTFTYSSSEQAFLTEELQEELGSEFKVTLEKHSCDYTITIVDFAATAKKTAKEIQEKLKDSFVIYCHDIQITSQTEYELACIKKELEKSDQIFQEYSAKQYNLHWIRIYNPNYDYKKAIAISLAEAVTLLFTSALSGIRSYFS